jgi:hypothetical protein
MQSDEPWARIPAGEGALESWFYSPETPAQRERGDMACDDNFAENAVCVEMDPVTFVAQLDVTRIRPSQQRYFVFYSQIPGTQTLEVWGGLCVETVLARRGLILRDEDLLRKPPQETRCRSMLTRPPGADRTPQDLSLWKTHYFLFPLANSMFQDDGYDSTTFVTGYVFDVFFKRLESYTVPVQASAAFPAGSTLEERLLDKGSFILCATLTRELYPPELALSYEKTRMERERILYWHRWAPFLNNHTDELPLLGLLQYNTGLWRWLLENVTEPDPEDEQAWFRTNGGAAAMPTLWFQIPCWQVPLALKMVRQEFPIHSGGIVHMPAYAPWIAHWIWDALVVPEAQRKYAMAPISKEHSLLHCLGMLEEARSWARRAKYPNAASTGGVVPRAATVAPPPALDEGGGVDIEDLHALWDVLPPCIRRIRDERRFPRNLERMVLAQAMRMGGLSLPSILYFFEKLNNKWPKPRPEPLSKRFDVESCLTWWREKDTDDPIWCSSLVNNALDKGPNAGVMVCPYAAAAGGGDDRAQLTGRCREQCVAESGLASARRQPHWKPWATVSGAIKEGVERAGCAASEKSLH